MSGGIESLTSGAKQAYTEANSELTKLDPNDPTAMLDAQDIMNRMQIQMSMASNTIHIFGQMCKDMINNFRLQ